jgi:hypothetical protein
MLGTTAEAVWEATAPGDPGRNWALNLGLYEGYDDNVYTTSRNPEGSFTSTIEPRLIVNLPSERSSLGLRYSYQAQWLTSLVNTPLRQSNIADLTYSYMFTPRLSLNISDSFRTGVNPQEVTDQNGVPVVQQQRGDYLYNNVYGTLSYGFSRRWIMSLSGSWNFWKYQQEVWAIPYNQNNYTGSLSAQYSINPQTFAGAVYQFSAVLYEHNNLSNTGWTDDSWPNVSDPGVPPTANIRDGVLNSFYGYINRRFNPQWSGQINAGFQWTVFGKGAYATQQTSPYFNISTSYNYGPRSAVSAQFGYSQSVAEVAQYRSTENTSLTIRIDHLLTTRLVASLYGTFNIGSYQNPLPGYSLSDEGTTSKLIAFNLTYAFNRWMQLLGNYTFDNVDSDVSGSYTRNRFNIGLRLLY